MNHERDILRKAVEELNQGKPIAIPTETVYGLAANGIDPIAVKRIFELKNRPLSNPLILHTNKLEKIKQYTTYIPDLAYLLAEQFWPGPLTMIFEKNHKVHDLITAGGRTVAFRVPDHPLTLKILEQLDFPLAAPSANPFTRISPTSAAQVHEYFGEEITIVDGGICSRGLESTIIGFENNGIVIYRLGSITEEDLQPFVSSIRINENKKDSHVRTPGMHKKHYSPITPTLLVEDPQQEIDKHEGIKIGVLSFKDLLLTSQNQVIKKVLSTNGDIKEAGSKLYYWLYELDKLDLDLIIVKEFPEKGLGKTINDRLRRAALQAK